MALTHRYGALTMADNPNPDHLRGWGAPIPDRLTPEERETLEDCRRRPGFGIPSVLFQALDRLAPKPAAEQKPADVPSGTFTVSERGASRFNAGKGVGTVYVQSSLDQPIEVTFRAKPAPDPDREAREAAAHFWVYDDPACVGCIRRAQPADFRAHGFAHRSEGALGNPWLGRFPLPDPAPSPAERSGAVSPAAVDVVREALKDIGAAWYRTSEPESSLEAFIAALAARGVTFGEGNDADLLAFASWCHMRVQRPNAEDVAVWRATGGRAS